MNGFTVAGCPRFDVPPRGRWSGAAAAAAVFVLAAASFAGAGSFPPSETVFPATTRAWISVADPGLFQESFDRTQFGQLLRDPVMKPFVDGFRAQLRSAGRQRLGKLGLTL
ncbi:MAG: hypothetical protein EBZ74_10545, partial [Planctomycetia bacterium]|nr:hypothetical protein [Planctomycetia bacterium]